MNSGWALFSKRPTKRAWLSRRGVCGALVVGDIAHYTCEHATSAIQPLRHRQFERKDLTCLANPLVHDAQAGRLDHGCDAVLGEIGSVRPPPAFLVRTKRLKNLAGIADVRDPWAFSDGKDAFPAGCPLFPPRERHLLR